MDNRYSRENYEHRNCLAITRTESGQFIKCLVHTGAVEDISMPTGKDPELGRKPEFNQVETDDIECPNCGQLYLETKIGQCKCSNDISNVRMFETGEAREHTPPIGETDDGNWIL